MKLYVNDTTETPAIANIEIITKNRIRIYAWKHHNILDWAEEFYRTDELNSFDKIMTKIINEKE